MWQKKKRYFWYYKEDKMKENKRKWYQEPWLWFLWFGPIVVVIAGIYTTYIAVNGHDPVLAKDYYKQGLTVNENIVRDAFARAHKMSAVVRWVIQDKQLYVTLKGDISFPEKIWVSVAQSSPKKEVAEVVRRQDLIHVGNGQYQLSSPWVVQNPEQPMWHIKLETTDWRLTGDWYQPQSHLLEMKADSRI